jgi:hypothetical protein
MARGTFVLPGSKTLSGQPPLMMISSSEPALTLLLTFIVGVSF